MEKRRPQFTESEKNRVIDLVIKYKHIIENRKSDALSVVEKKKAWEKLTEEFNSSSDLLHQRTVIQLKKCWDNIKFKRKSELAAEKQERLRSGGGVFTPCVQEDFVWDALGTVKVEISDSSTGSDTAQVQKQLPSFPVVRNGFSADTPEYEPDDLTSKEKKRKLDLEERVARNNSFIDNDKALHEEKMVTECLKQSLVSLQIEHEEEMFRANMELLGLEKKKKLLEIKQLERQIGRADNSG